MITPKPFYQGNPLDGAVVSAWDMTNIRVHDLGVQVPTAKRWKIEEITVCNMTQIDGLYSVAVFPSWVTSGLSQPPAGELNYAIVPPRSGAAAVTNPSGASVRIGHYIAFSQPIFAATTLTMPVAVWALSDEKLWAGVYPGQIALIGAGGLSIAISGREYGA